MHARCTVLKFRFLNRMIESNDSISYSVFSARSDDVESLCLVKECRALKSKYDTNFTSKILLRDMGSSLRDMKKKIYVKDRILTLQKVSHFNGLIRIKKRKVRRK